MTDRGVRSMSKEAMHMALDALERLITYDNHGEPYDGKDVEGAEAIEALRAALSQQNSALYTAPPQRKPLSDKQIEDVFFGMGKFAKIDLKHFARAIEVAHGIGEKS